MKSSLYRAVLRELLKVRPGLIPLVVFTVLLGLVNLLVVNQKVVLYLFYLPVVFAAWALRKRDAVGMAILATVLVMAYVVFLPERFQYTQSNMLLWMELAIWSGILIVTAYLVATLRVWTQQAMRSLERAYGGVLSILTKFIETVDADTEAHSTRVSLWAVRIAEELGLKREAVEEVRIAGLLHDVGKVNVSVEILRKAATLSQAERDEVRLHATAGADMVRPVGGMLTHIADAIECHHEKYDGTGYKKMQAEEIPLMARIIAVADAFDAMLSDRPYRKGMDIREAIDAVISCSGTHFDPMVVAALQAMVNRDGEGVLTGTTPSVSAIGGFFGMD